MFSLTRWDAEEKGGERWGNSLQLARRKRRHA
jgi:hypothetical protein